MDGVCFLVVGLIKKTVHRKEGSEQLFRKNIKNRKNTVYEVQEKEMKTITTTWKNE